MLRLPGFLHWWNRQKSKQATDWTQTSDEEWWRQQSHCSEVVYQATITTRDKKETYIGLTATQFKARYRNHLMSFRHEKRRNETELSKHLWQLKEANKEFDVTWKILAKAKPYTNLTKRCNLCTTEQHWTVATLNKRNELVSTCRHRRKFTPRYNWTCQSQRL